MTRSHFRRSLRFDNLESRQLLSAGGPTAEQQYMLELINAARMNPQAAADRMTSNLSPDVSATLDYYRVDLNATKQAIASSTPKQPLAWNPALAVAAQAHSQDMANTKTQSHSGSDGSSSDSRMAKAGYNNTRATGENAYAYASGVDEAMQAFLIDWGVADQGHRRNLLQSNVAPEESFQDVGIGIVKTGDPKFGPMVVTQDFGSRNNSLPQLLGVAYGDNDNSQSYNPGEGRRDVQIEATNLDTGVNYATTTQDAGGYQMPIPAGRYQVTASVNDQVVKKITLNIGNQNVKQDFLLNKSWDGGSRQQAAPTANLASTRASVSSVPTPVPTVATTIAPPSLKTDKPALIGSWTSWKAKMA